MIASLVLDADNSSAPLEAQLQKIGSDHLHQHLNLPSDDSTGYTPLLKAVAHGRLDLCQVQCYVNIAE